jgi:hypothetical protein
MDKDRELIIDCRGLPPDKQVFLLKEQYCLLKGKGAIVRARVGELPVRQYVSLLEQGHRVWLERNQESTTLVLRPDESTELGVKEQFLWAALLLRSRLGIDRLALNAES